MKNKLFIRGIRYLSLCILVTLIFGRPVCSVSVDWVLMGGSLNLNMAQSAQRPKVAFDGNSTAYVAWYENNLTVYVKQWNGSIWARVGGGLNVNAALQAQFPEIDCSNIGVPWVTWREGGPSKNYVKHWNGLTWVQDGTSLNLNANAAAFQPQIAFAAAMPYVAWTEVQKVYVKFWGGATWTQIGGALNVNGTLVATQPAISVLNNAFPYVSWSEGVVPMVVYVKHWNGAAWVQDGGGLNLNLSTNASGSRIACSNTKIYVAWNEYNGTHYQTYVKHWNGTTWVQDGGSLNVNGAFDDYSCDIALLNQTPYVAFYESNGLSNQLYVKKWNGIDWELDGGSLNVNSAQSADYPSLASSNDTLYLAWSETLGGVRQVYAKAMVLTRTDTPTTTNTPTATITLTATPSFTVTPTRTISSTCTASPTRTRTGTRTLTITPTISTTATVVLPSMTVTPNLSGGTLTIQTPVVRLSRGGSLRATLWLTRPQQVTLKVYDLQGKRLGTLIDGRMPQGTSEIVWDGGKAGSGVCYLYLETEDQKLRRKVVLVR